MKSSLKGILRSVCSKTISVVCVVGDGRRIKEKSVGCLNALHRHFKRLVLELRYGPWCSEVARCFDLGPYAGLMGCSLSDT